MAHYLDTLDDLREGLDTFVEKWANIQRKSVKAIQAVTNTIMQIEHLDGPIGKLESFSDLRENAKGILLVNLYDKLVPALETSIREFTKLMHMFENLRQTSSKIQTLTETMRGNLQDSPDLEDLIGFLDLVMISVRDILNMYESEFLVKLTIFRDFEEGAIEIGVVSNYLTIWGIEPNIEAHARDKLLKDLDEHVELLKDVFSGKTGIRIPDAYKRIQL
ncbi:MAG: hypothetical protein AM325_003410 [Candidatus Thorarchaeota archaeon SMTZ1-45]|nr:MAG: hypothetical protein AM325_05185 [Candidatus Thorarchaeota archaeon SMTZ1-45]